MQNYCCLLFVFSGSVGLYKGHKSFKTHSFSRENIGVRRTQ